MSKIVLDDIAAGYGSTSKLNSNFDTIEEAFDNTLSRDGTSPNSMLANLDMNSKRILNLPAATTNTEPVTYAQFQAAQGNLLYSGTIGAAAVEFTPSGGSDVDLQSFLNYTVGRTAGEINAGVTPSNFAYKAGSPRRYGAAADGVTNDYTAVAAAISTGHTIDLEGKSYLINSELNFNKANQVIENGTLIFNGNNTIHLAEVTANDVTFRDVIFDGNDKQPYSSLLWVADNVQRPRWLNCTFKDMLGRNWGSSPLNGMYALLISPHGVVNFEIKDCLFQNLWKYNDGAGMSPVTTAFIGGGYVGGVCFLPEDLNPSGTAQTTVTQGSITGCTFDSIQTIRAGSLSLNDQIDLNDADAIRTYGDSNTPGLYVTVSNCIFKKVGKRCFKFRASGSQAFDNVAYGTGMTYPMVTCIDVTSNSKVDGFHFFTSSAQKAYSIVSWSTGPDTNQETLVQNIFGSYCLNALIFFSDPGFGVLKNFTLRNATFYSVEDAGVLSSSPVATDYSNIVIDCCQFIGAANDTIGIQTIAGSSTGNAGLRISNTYFKDCNINCAGGDNTLTGVKVDITNSSWAVSSTTWVVRIGESTGANQFVDGLVINASGLSTSYVDANRGVLLLSGAGGTFRDISLRVPQGSSGSLRHVDMAGTNLTLDGFVYDGPSFTNVGTSSASTDLIVKNAVRTRAGGSATTQPFFNTNNAGTSRVAYHNITDTRDPGGSTPSVQVTAGSNLAVNGLISAASAAQVSSTGGVVATTGTTRFATPTQAYALTNVATLRTMDAATISSADLADVVGTLINDLRDRGLVRF